MLQHKFNLLFEGFRLQFRRVDRRIRCAYHHLAVPRYGEQNAAIVGVRHHDGTVARQKVLVEHQVDALARRNNRFSVFVVHSEQCICERTGGVDHNPSVNPKLLARQHIFHFHAVDHIVRFHQAGHLHVVDQNRAVVGGRLRQVYGQPRIVELPVVVDHTAAKAAGLYRGDGLNGFLQR